MKIHSSEYVKYKTIEGKDQWLFLWDIDGLTEIVTGKTKHTELQLEIAARAAELRQHWCEARGIVYVHTIAPDKSSVYPQFLPNEVQYEPNGILAQCTEALSRSSVTFVDSWYIAKEQAAIGQAYFRTDSHWNYQTAYKVLRQLMAPVTNAFPLSRVLDEDQLVTKQRETVMELAALLPEPYQEASERLLPSRPASKCVFKTESSRGRILVYESNRKNLPSCVIFRDSFSSFFLDILCESFSRVVAINSRIFWYDLIEKERPDVVIMELAERFLDPVVTDLHIRSFEQTFQVSIETIAQTRK